MSTATTLSSLGIPVYPPARANMVVDTMKHRYTKNSVEQTNVLFMLLSFVHAMYHVVYISEWNETKKERNGRKPSEPNLFSVLVSFFLPRMKMETDFLSDCLVRLSVCLPALSAWLVLSVLLSVAGSSIQLKASTVFAHKYSVIQNVEHSYLPCVWNIAS